MPGNFFRRVIAPTQSKPSHEHVQAQSFASIGPHTEGQAANGSGTPRIPQYRFSLAGDFSRRRDLGANNTAWASTEMAPTAQHERHGRAGEVSNDIEKFIRPILSQMTVYLKGATHSHPELSQIAIAPK
jgi:hypothetical protein